jgi:phytoene synthase
MLALSYAQAPGRGALGALLALDDALAQLLRTTREPALGQMRLAWWREALARLDHDPVPAEPVLSAHTLFRSSKESRLSGCGVRW